LYAVLQKRVNLVRTRGWFRRGHRRGGEADGAGGGDGVDQNGVSTAGIGAA